MNTSLIAVLICFGLCIKIALTIVAIHYFQRPASKGTGKQKRKGGQRKAAARKKAVSPAASESSPKPIAKEPAVPSPNKTIKPAPVFNEQQPEKKAETKAPGATAVTTEPKRMEKPRGEAPEAKTPVTKEAINLERPRQEPPPVRPPQGERKMTKVVTGPPQEKGERIGVVEIRKKAQLKDTTPAQTSGQMGPSKEAAVSRTPVTGAPQNQAAAAGPKSVEKPSQEAAPVSPGGVATDKSSGAIEPDMTAVKEGESAMTAEPGTGDSQTSSEPPAEETEAEEKEQDKAQKDKSGLGDLADLFATSASDFTEKSKLSEQVNEVDVSDILKEGLDLLGKVKKPDK